MTRYENMKNPTAERVLLAAELRAREGPTSIAALLDTSEQLVQYHLRRLEAAEAILGYNALVDVQRIGYSFHLLYLSFFGLTSAEELRWIKYVASEVSGVALVARTIGRWNALVGVIAANNRELASIVTKVCKHATGKVADLVITTEVECTYSSLQLLGKWKPVVISTSTDADSEHSAIDELDLQILEALARDCRPSAAEIARILGSSPSTTLRRIDELERRRVILGYRVQIDYEQYGFYQYRLLLRLSDSRSSTLSDIGKFALESGVVESVSRYLGMADLDIRCYARTLTNLADFVAALRDRFHTIVTNVDIVPVFYWRRMNYFPVSLEFGDAKGRPHKARA